MSEKRVWKSKEWKSAGWTDLEKAYQWFLAGWDDPEEALEWYEMGWKNLSPADALEFYKAGWPSDWAYDFYIVAGLPNLTTKELSHLKNWWFYSGNISSKDTLKWYEHWKDKFPDIASKWYDSAYDEEEDTSLWDPKDAREWFEYFDDPKEAFKWYSFAKRIEKENPELCKKVSLNKPRIASWWASGFPDPEQAFLMMKLGFTKPNDAKWWYDFAKENKRFSLEELARWYRAGFDDFEDAVEWIDAGWKEPQEAFSWYKIAPLKPEKCLQWFLAGWKAEDAEHWMDYNWDSPETALEWKKAGWENFYSDTAFKWYSAGWTNPELALKFFKENPKIDPKQALEEYERRNKKMVVNSFRRIMKRRV